MNLVSSIAIGQHYLQKGIPLLLFVFIFLLPFDTKAQEAPQDEPKSDFWDRVQIGGGLGLGFGSGYANIAVAPSAIYNV